MSAEVGLTEAVVDALHNGLHPDSLSWRDGDADGSDHWIEAEIGEVADAILASDWLAERDARIKADAIAQERAAHEWVVDDIKKCWAVDMRDARQQREARLALAARIEALADEWERPTRPAVSGWQQHAAKHLRALLSSDATAACACVCHSGGVGTGCRQSRCEVCPPATAALNTVREQAKAEERVHDHPPYRPACNERLVEGQLRGACLNDDGSEAGR